MLTSLKILQEETHLIGVHFARSVLQKSLRAHAQGSADDILAVNKKTEGCNAAVAAEANVCVGFPGPESAD